MALLVPLGKTTLIVDPMFLPQTFFFLTVEYTMPLMS